MKKSLIALLFLVAFLVGCAPEDTATGEQDSFLCAEVEQLRAESAEAGLYACANEEGEALFKVANRDDFGINERYYDSAGNFVLENSYDDSEIPLDNSELADCQATALC